MAEITIERSSPFDVVMLAKIHQATLPEDFLPSLGRDFLEKVYYPVALRSGNAATLVARNQGQVVGFVTVSHDSSHYMRDVIGRSWVKMSLYTLRAILFHPPTLLKSLEILYSTLFSEPDPIKSEIVFIAVDPECHRQGIGSQLVISALQYLEQRGIRECRTKTLTKNHHVIKMYEKLGWQVRDQFKLIGNSYSTVVLETRNG